jgi:hypothetical protein
MRARFFRFLIPVSLTAHVIPVAATPPSVEITNVPPFGSFADLGGRVLNGNPASQKVAVFIYVPSAGWWSKPYCDPQLTPIQPDGSWSADITTGGADAFATKITALLVEDSYHEPCVTGPATLPSGVMAQALASATVERADPAVRWISFSGYDWWVKASPGQLGPGPNYFSDSTNNVWLDALGRLHLRITNRSNQWQCAEVVTRRTFGHGSYRFELDVPVNDLNPSVVLGLFTWSDDPAYAHREIDIECGRWANSNDVNNAQYVIQPWDLADHLVRYAVPAALTKSTHLFTWETNRVSFQSQRGSYSPAPAPTNLISTWEFTHAGEVPQTGDENIRINLWLINGTPPTDGHEVEVIVNRFQFVPLGSPLAATLSHPHSQDDQFSFELATQRDRRYLVQMSTNLTDWQDLDELLATNNLMNVSTTNRNVSISVFYRTVTLP